ncbi:MAG: hypothetical protein ACYDB7_07565 [Mycobacteriales bacterium]
MGEPLLYKGSAFAYGFGAVILGTTLERRGISATRVGVVLAAIVAGAEAPVSPGNEFGWEDVDGAGQ